MNNVQPKRTLGAKRIFIAAASVMGLVLIGSLSFRYATASAMTEGMGLTTRSLEHTVTFAYPRNFVQADDGGPHMALAGGALLNKNKSAYNLLVGVAIDSHPHATVSSVRRELLQMYRNDSLLSDKETPYGRELIFAMPARMTYKVYLSALHNGVREIIVNNEHSDSKYQPIISAFLHSVHNEH